MSVCAIVPWKAFSEGFRVQFIKNAGKKFPNFFIYCALNNKSSLPHERGVVSHAFVDARRRVLLHRNAVLVCEVYAHVPLHVGQQGPRFRNLRIEDRLDLGKAALRDSTMGESEREFWQRVGVWCDNGGNGGVACRDAPPWSSAACIGSAAARRRGMRLPASPVRWRWWSRTTESLRGGGGGVHTATHTPRALQEAHTRATPIAARGRSSSARTVGQR